MPGMSGIEATRLLLEADPGTRVLIFSAEARRDVVLAARDAGAAGFVRKGCGESEVIRAIRFVMVGLPARGKSLIAQKGMWHGTMLYNIMH